jgi:hypothetical protein
MQKILTTFIRILMLVTVLVGCRTERGDVDAPPLPTTASSTPESTPTRQQSTAIASTLLIQTATPNQTPSPTPRASLPEQLLFDGQLPDCELPCWLNLKVGQSTELEIQNTFDTVFHLNGREIFSEESLGIGSGLENIPGLTFVLWGTTISQEPFQRFEAQIWVTEEDHLLQGIRFRSLYEPYNTTLSLQRIFQELGIPEYFYAGAGDIGLEDFASIILMPVYSRGVAFMITMYVPILSRQDNSFTFEYCLDSPYPRSNDERAFVSISTDVYLVSPFETIANLDRLQEYLIGSEIQDRGLLPFQDVFGVSTAQIQAQMESDETNCLHSQPIFVDDTGIGS